MDGQMDGWVDEWMGGWVDGPSSIQVVFCLFICFSVETRKQPQLTVLMIC